MKTAARKHELLEYWKVLRTEQGPQTEILIPRTGNKSICMPHSCFISRASPGTLSHSSQMDLRFTRLQTMFSPKE